MKILDIKTQEHIWKTEEEQEKERKERNAVCVLPYRTKPLKEPVYIVEMTPKEFQLISFYIELERRNPIINTKLNAELVSKKRTKEE